MNFPIADPVDSLWERIYVWYGFEGATAARGVLPKEDNWDDWIDGHATSEGGVVFTGEEQSAQAARYARQMIKAIEVDVRKAPEAILHVQVAPQGGTVSTTVTVDSLAPQHSEVYVRVLLVEDTIHLRKRAGRSGQPRLDHYMVVRLAARTGKYPLGLPLSGPGTVHYTFDVAKEQQRLLRYRAMGLSAVPGAAEWEVDARDEVKQIIGLFPDARNWRMDPTRLHIVAFVQDAKTGDVLQAAMVKVPGLVLP